MAEWEIMVPRIGERNGGLYLPLPGGPGRGAWTATRLTWVADCGSSTDDVPAERASQARSTIPSVDSPSRQAWTTLSTGLFDAASIALQAINAKNAEGLLDAGEKIDAACETCHLKYWYPNQLAALAGNASPRK